MCSSHLREPYMNSWYCTSYRSRCSEIIVDFNRRELLCKSLTSSPSCNITGWSETQCTSLTIYNFLKNPSNWRRNRIGHIIQHAPRLIYYWDVNVYTRIINLLLISQTRITFGNPNTNICLGKVGKSHLYYNY